MTREQLREHRELEYLRAAGRARTKRGVNRRQLGRATERWRKLRRS